MQETTLTRGNLEETQEAYQKHIMATYARFPVVFERGEGPYLWSTDGRRYLDFLAGIAVNAVGHCHPRVVEAIQHQAARLIHVSNLYLISQQAELAQTLCRLSGMEKAFFANSGAEANEAAIKIARKFGRSIRDDKTALVGAEGSFHGRTLGALSLTGQEKYQKPYEPLVPNCSIVPWNNIGALEAAVSDRTCAIVLEPVQGEGGVRPADPEYLQAARDLADRYDALLIFDEVQTGCGRTGTFFAFQGYGVTPDILTVAKAMGGGFPIGGCLARGRAAEVFQPGDHGTTYGGGPLACAAALAALEVIEQEGLADNARKMGRLLEEGLRSLNPPCGVREVRGKGLMLAMVLEQPVARDVLNAAFEEGLLINAIGTDVLRFLPPLIIGEDHISECLELLKKAFARIGA
ncbi:MAG: acetylornithine aminotransferase [Armatimonadota bacterium]|nr:MAG: acetylornithine aminotransferase [Armatimonadota bacterium]